MACAIAACVAASENLEPLIASRFLIAGTCHIVAERELPWLSSRMTSYAWRLAVRSPISEEQSSILPREILSP
jgi:hypothetical protein